MLQAIRKTLAKPILHRAIPIAWVGLVIGFIGYYSWHNWGVFSSYDWRLNSLFMVTAIAWDVVRRLLGGIGWVLIAMYDRKERSWPEVFDHLRVYFISNLGNYIPGSVWSVASRIQMNRGRQISTLRTSMGVAYEMGLLVGSGCMVSLYIIVTKFDLSSWSIAGLVIFLIALSLLMIHPTSVNLLLRYVLRALKRSPKRVKITFGWGIRLWLLSIAVWLSAGLSLFFLLKSLHSILSPALLPDIISVYALAWTIGFLAPWAPSGLGVRDGVMVWLLGAYVEAPLPVVAAVVHRMINMVADLMWASISLLLSRVRTVSNEDNVAKHSSF